MKKAIKKSFTVITMLALLLILAMPMTAQAKTKAKPKLNKTNATLTITNKEATPSVTLKVKNITKTVKWTTSNKEVATVKKINKYTCKVTAKKSGKATITAKVNGKKYNCKITVKDKSTKKTLTITDKKSFPLMLLDTGYDLTGSKTMKWTSSNEDVVWIDDEEDQEFCKVFALQAGTAKITAKIGNKKWTWTITVKDNSTGCHHRWKIVKKRHLKCYCDVWFCQEAGLDKDEAFLLEYTWDYHNFQNAINGIPGHEGYWDWGIMDHMICTKCGVEEVRAIAFLQYGLLHDVYKP